MLNPFTLRLRRLESAGSAPELVALRKARTAQDWPRIRQLLLTIPAADDRYLATREIVRAGSHRFFRRVSTENPGDPLAALLLGGALLEQGWAARGYGRAAGVSRSRFATFHQFLREADSVLLQVTAGQPSWADAWAWRLACARGLELGPAESVRRYEAAAAQTPHPVAAQLQLLQTLLPKWSGNWQAAEEFARSCSAEAPGGAPNHLLVPQVHLERLLDANRAHKPLSHQQRPEVRAEVLAAAQRGPLNPGFRPGLHRKAVLNTFAMSLTLSDEHQAAVACFEALGKDVSMFPWSYLGAPDTMFASLRGRARRKARRSRRTEGRSR